jgi:hypothetical protein
VRLVTAAMLFSNAKLRGMNVQSCDTGRCARILRPTRQAIRLSFLVAIVCSYSGLPFRIASQTQAPTANSIQFRLISREIIQSRLNLYNGSDKDREMTLLRLFEEAGCSQKNISEQAIPHHKEANVICTLPGESSEEIIVGAHFDHAGEGNGVIDNWSGASMLPAFFQSLSSANRKHTLFLLVSLAKKSDKLVHDISSSKSQPTSCRQYRSW